MEEADRQNYPFAFDLKKGEGGISAEVLFDKLLCNYVSMDAELESKRVQLNKQRSQKKSAIDILSDQEDQGAREWSHRLLEKIDKFSLSRFLAEEASLTSKKKDKGNLSQGAKDFICGRLVYDMHMPSSMSAILGDYIELYKADRFFQIEGGMDLLPGLIANEIKAGENGVNIIYNARVIEIRHREGRKHPLQIIYENTASKFRIDMTGKDERGKDSYDLVIIAVPFSALRHVRLERSHFSLNREILESLGF
jgi:hypothetical protein